MGLYEYKALLLQTCGKVLFLISDLALYDVATALRSPNSLEPFHWCHCSAFLFSIAACHFDALELICRRHLIPLFTKHLFLFLSSPNLSHSYSVVITDLRAIDSSSRVTIGGCPDLRKRSRRLGLGPGS